MRGDVGRSSRALARCIEIFDEYYRVADKKKSKGFVALRGCEVKERLQQMNWLLEQIRPRDQELSAINARSGQRMKEHIERLQRANLSYADTPVPPDWPLSRADCERITELMFKIQLYTECFYYVAGRARSILRTLPNLKSFDAQGVRNVRNHLIEHPEGKASGVLSRSFAFGGKHGPMVKAIRDSGETAFPDAGLFVNAREFAKNCESSLISALKAL
jgi:hypothetical protein